MGTAAQPSMGAYRFFRLAYTEDSTKAYVFCEADIASVVLRHNELKLKSLVRLAGKANQIRAFRVQWATAYVTSDRPPRLAWPMHHPIAYAGLPVMRGTDVVCAKLLPFAKDRAR